MEVLLSSTRSHVLQMRSMEGLWEGRGTAAHDIIAELPQPPPALGRHACALPGQRKTLQGLDSAPAQCIALCSTTPLQCAP